MMASQAEPPIHGQPSVNKAGPIQGQPSVSNVGPSDSGGEPFKHVTRDNGVTFSASDTISIQSYMDQFTKQHKNKNVVSASRISNGRIAVYLGSKGEVVDAVQQGIAYNGTFIELTPLVRPTTRITLSNVYPEIPNSVLIKNLSSFCKVVSQIRPIPLGLKQKNLSHIMSFRRQVHVLLAPNISPPDHLNLTFSGVNYRVFLTTESVRCFNCGEFGHISKNCKKPQPNEGNNQHDAHENPLNPPPVFKKADPKHPPKTSHPNPPAKQTVPPKPVPQASMSKPSKPAAPSGGATPSTGGAAPPVGAPPTGGASSKSMDETSAGGPDPLTIPETPSPSPKQNPKHPLKQKPISNQSEKNLSVWGSPPKPSRLFSDVISDAKKTPAKSSSSPPSKMMKLTPQNIKGTPVPAVPKPNDSPSVSQALNTQPPVPSSPAGDANTDTDSVMWEDAQSEDELPLSFLPTKGPLTRPQLASFLSQVKAKRKQGTIAKKYTSDIPGLVKQLKPLRNHTLLSRKMQQRIQKLVKSLDN